MILFDGRHELREVVRQIPLDRILLETDSPYFKMENLMSIQTSFNLPGAVMYTASEVSKLKQIPLNEVLTATFDNYKKVYAIETPYIDSDSDMSSHNFPSPPTTPQTSDNESVKSEESAESDSQSG